MRGISRDHSVPRSKFKGPPVVTPAAVYKDVITKRPLIIVARGTALNPSAREVHCRDRSRDLCATPGSGPNRMAGRTTHSLSRVIGVAEVDRECACRLRCSHELSGLMACGTRSNVVFPDHRPRSVTLKTSRMSAQPRRNRKRDAAACWLMARRAVRLTHVACVIEYSIKTPKRRKPLDVCGRVTDRADGVRITFGELLDMA